MAVSYTHLEAGLDVMLIDQGELGTESTWAGGGILSPLYPWNYHPAITLLSQYGQQHYPALCQKLQAVTDVDPQWIRSGLVFTDDRELAAAQAWAQQFGYDLQHLATPEALHADVYKRQRQPQYNVEKAHVLQVSRHFSNQRQNPLGVRVRLGVFHGHESHAAACSIWFCKVARPCRSMVSISIWMKRR